MYIYKYIYIRNTYIILNFAGTAMTALFTCTLIHTCTNINEYEICLCIYINIYIYIYIYI
jgi:hypothetical protein